MNRLLVGLPLLAASFTTAVFAEPRQLEEVLVTAQKKTESLQDTPIALDAFGEEALERDGIGNVGDLANNVPAMTIQPFPINTTTLRIYIRGIGLIDAQITQDPPVGVYIDGAYIARSAALATDLADLTRIEVLRGPQGTLYGRNSTAGAVNLVTRRPDTEAVRVKQAFSVGDRDLFSSKTMINVPLTSGLAAKLAYLRRQVDGYIENTGEGGDFGDSETDGLRLDIAWEVSDTLRLDYAYDHTEVVNTNMVYSHQRPSDPIANPGLDQGILFTNLINVGARQFFDFSGGGRPERLYSAIPFEEAETEITGHQLTLAWQLSDTAELKYLYAGRELYDRTPTILATGASSDGFRLDNSPVFSFPVAAQPGASALCSPCIGRSVQYGAVHPVVDQRQFSHELQFSGDLLGGQLSYITGVYYFEEEARQGSGNIGHLLSAPLGSLAELNTTGNRIEVLSQARFDIENSAAAVFAQFTWRPPVMDERLSLTLGARHSEDNRKADALRRQITFLVVPGDLDNTDRDDADIATQLSDVFYDVAGDKDFKDDSFTFIAEYEAADDINLYFKVSEAYKSGGFNTREQVTPEGAQRFADGFDEEKVTAYELGIKSRFFDNRFQFNADIFQQDFVDQQLNFSVPNTTSDTTVANAGESTLKGFEMDATWLASENLLLILNYAYLSANIEPSRNPLSGELDDGFVFDSAPRHAYTASAEWTLWRSPQWGELVANATYAFTDERNGGGVRDFATFDADRQDDFAVLNGRVGWYGLPMLDGVLDLALWSKNLLDEEYSISNVHNLPQSGRSVIYGEPRSYGLDLIYRWDS